MPASLLRDGTLEREASPNRTSRERVSLCLSSLGAPPSRSSRGARQKERVIFSPLPEWCCYCVRGEGEALCGVMREKEREPAATAKERNDDGCKDRVAKKISCSAAERKKRQYKLLPSPYPQQLSSILPLCRMSSSIPSSDLEAVLDGKERDEAERERSLNSSAFVFLMQSNKHPFSRSLFLLLLNPSLQPQPRRRLGRL